MRIAAPLAGAALAALLMLPAAAYAGAGPARPQVAHQQAFGEPETASIAGTLEVTERGDESADLVIQKRKKPQFQTRFFGE